MKRTVPLVITAAGGFVLIGAYFIPYAQNWGELAAIWFDVLAAVAFILGGGNLLKQNLKRISDRGRSCNHQRPWVVRLSPRADWTCFNAYSNGAS